MEISVYKTNLKVFIYEILLKKYFQYIGMYSTQIYEAIENLVIDLIKFSKELDESILKVIFL